MVTQVMSMLFLILPSKGHEIFDPFGLGQLIVHIFQDWDQWLVLLRIQFIRQSPSAALRACAPLADVHVSLAK